jgi:hypothetical protein
MQKLESVGPWRCYEKVSSVSSHWLMLLFRGALALALIVTVV